MRRNTTVHSREVNPRTMLIAMKFERDKGTFFQGALLGRSSGRKSLKMTDSPREQRLRETLNKAVSLKFCVFSMPVEGFGFGFSHRRGQASVARS